jgi:putative inorganic carbon (hco3(-)) transporter
MRSYLTPAPPPLFRWLACLFLLLLCIVAMALTSTEMAWLRQIVQPLSRAMSWLERLETPFDMDHVAFFTALAFAARLLGPSVRGWWFIAVFAALAASTELMQYWVPGRTPKLLDARDDMVGTAVGLLFGALVLRGAAHAAGMLRLSGWLLVAGVLFLPLQQWTPLSAFDFPVLVSDLLFAFAIGLRGLAWLGGGAPLRWSGFHLWLLAFIVAMAAACVHAIPFRPPTSGEPLACLMPLPSVGSYVGKFLGICYLALLALVTSDLVMCRSWLKRVVLAWLVGASLASLVSIITILAFYLSPGAEWFETFLNHYGSLLPGPYPRVRSLFNYASMLCNFLCIAMCLLWAARASGWIRRSVFRIQMTMLLIALAATETPGLGGAALAAGMMGWWTFQERSPTLARTLAATGVAAAAVMLAITCVSLTAPLDMPSQRWLLWTQAMQTWLAHPWRGIGLGLPVAGLSIVVPSGDQLWLSNAHNTWLSVAGQTGIPGLFTLVGLSAWLMRSGWQTVRASGAADMLPRALMLAFAVAFLYDGMSGSFEDARHLWVLMGLLCGVCMAIKISQSPFPTGLESDRALLLSEQSCDA